MRDATWFFSRLTLIIGGTVLATLALVFALMFAPVEDPEHVSPLPEQAQVQSAQAWWYTTALCSSGFKRGDWIQHWDTNHRAHRSTKISHRYQVGRGIYLNIRKESVYYNDSRTRVVRKVDRGSYPVLCERV